MQKVEKCGIDGDRFYWNIRTNLTSGEYRSRCSTTTAVRAQLKRHGHTVISITAAKA